jgi:hypothetical protein
VASMLHDLQRSNDQYAALLQCNNDAAWLQCNSGQYAALFAA